MSDAVTVRVDWSDATLARAGAAHTALVRNPFLGGALNAGLLALLALFVMVAARLIGVARGSGDVSSLDYGAAVTDMLYAMFLGWVILGVYHRLVVTRVMRRRHGVSDYHAAPWEVTLSAAGVSAVGPASREHMDWNAVSSVAPFRSGLVLSIGRGNLLPLPDSGLPDGLNRAELKLRIEAWRSAAEF